jgi:hypothetical protein
MRFYTILKSGITVLSLQLILSVSIVAQTRNTVSSTVASIPSMDALAPALSGISSDAEKKVFLSEFSILRDISGHLLKFRNEFLAKGNFINLFPTAYYFTTVDELQEIAKGKYQYPIEKMKQMIAFYDAYAFNRSRWDAGMKEAVEAHWREHFRFAESSSTQLNLFCMKVGQVLATAVTAHVKYDLPRALRYAFQHRFNTAIKTDDTDLWKDFMATNAIFTKSMQQTIADVAKARTGCAESIMSWIASDPDSYSITLANTLNDYYPTVKKLFNLQEVFTATDVVYLRESAWRQAFSDEKLLGPDAATLLPQPVLNHKPANQIPAAKAPGNYSDPGDLYKEFSFIVKGNLKEPVSTNIQVEKNDYIFIWVKGEISVGSFLGKADGSGLYKDNIFSAMYNKYADCRHGSLVAEINDQIEPCKRIFDDIGKQYNLPWVTPDYGDNVKERFFDVDYVPGTYFLCGSSGSLKLDINDGSPDNNTGQFEVHIYKMSYKDHLSRNIFNRCPLREPQNNVDCSNNTWEQESFKSWFYHGIGNNSYRGLQSKAGCQCVYDDGKLLISGENQGSFDIAYWRYKGNTKLANANFLHLILDVIPHDFYTDALGSIEYSPSVSVPCK